jgi:hypothetical protein
LIETSARSGPELLLEPILPLDLVNVAVTTARRNLFATTADAAPE